MIYNLLNFLLCCVKSLCPDLCLEIISQGIILIHTSYLCNSSEWHLLQQPRNLSFLVPTVPTLHCNVTAQSLRSSLTSPEVCSGGEDPSQLRLQYPWGEHGATGFSPILPHKWIPPPGTFLSVDWITPSPSPSLRESLATSLMIYNALSKNVHSQVGIYLQLSIHSFRVVCVGGFQSTTLA